MLRRLKLFLVGVFSLYPVSVHTQALDKVPVPEHTRSGPPEIAFTEDGTLWIAWPSYQDGRFRLAVSSRKDTAWTPIDYPDGSATDQIEPQWITVSSGELNVVYAAYVDRHWEIRRVVRTEGDWSMPQVLGRGNHPTATATRDRLWIAWQQNTEIAFVSIPKGDGRESQLTPSVLQPEEPMRAYSHPQLSSGPDGEVWLVWDAAQYGYQSVLLERIDTPNQPILVADSGTGINRNPRISVDGKGRVWVVFEALEADRETNDLVYVLDQTYGVEKPSRVVTVTDGKTWWKTEEPTDPALGLMPNIFCSQEGTVWLLSRRFKGFSQPFHEFYPLCEGLGPHGWENFGAAWSEGRHDKAVSSMAVSPSGDVWTAWVQNDRIKTGYLDTPSWTLLDAEDTIAVASMPAMVEPGYPELIPLVRDEVDRSEPPLFPRYETSYRGETLRVYFGDLHQHSELSTCGRHNAAAEQNQHYSRHVRGLDFMCTIDHAEHLNDHNWRTLQLAAEKDNRPGEFVTFSGFEWTSEFDAGGNLYRGHYNAIFRDVGRGDYYFSASDPLYNTPLELWDALKEAVGGKDGVLTFPHHPGRRMAWISWNYYDPEMVPLIEIAQARGSYEYEGCFSNQMDNDCSRVRGHYIHDGLARGMRWGFIAGGDHAGRQLTAVFSPELERGALFDNLKSRRAYATDGERMFLDVRVNGHFMGEEFTLDQASREITISATGTAPLIQIDLFRNNRVIQQWNMHDPSQELTYVDNEPLPEHENYYYVRVQQERGAMAWSSPIWIVNPNVPGRFRFQVGGDELRVIYPEQETDFAVLMHNETSETVRGKAVLDVPADWNVKEVSGIAVDVPPGDWGQVVFHVRASAANLARLCLPKVIARFESSDIGGAASPLFVVGSPTFLSREQKATLIDARTEIPPERFGDYLMKMAEVWKLAN